MASRSPDRPVFHHTLGRYFAGLREARGFKKLRQAAAFATRNGFDRLTLSTLQRIESGRAKHPEPDVLRQLAAFYEGPSYEELLRKWLNVLYGETAADGVQAQPTVTVADARVPVLELEVEQLRVRLAGIADATHRLVHLVEGPAPVDASRQQSRRRVRQLGQIGSLLPAIDDKHLPAVLLAVKGAIQATKADRLKPRLRAAAG